jgi:hypothetical protein
MYRRSAAECLEEKARIAKIKSRVVRTGENEECPFAQTEQISPPQKGFPRLIWEKEPLELV